jgi:TrmH family RNA methyltransferase
MQLTSSRNPWLQSIRRAAAAGKPTEDGLVVAEGAHLLEEALRPRSGKRWVIERVFATAEAREHFASLLAGNEFEVVEVSARAMEATAATDAPQGILTLLRPPVWAWEDLVADQQLPLLFLDGIQDPGNTGTLVRSAEAFGASGVVFSKGSARISNGKFLRATAGSIFRMPHIEDAEPKDASERCRRSGLSVFALTPSASRSIFEAQIGHGCALVIGSEGRGVSRDVLDRAEELRIPARSVESLNAAVAGSIALFASQQQRHAA